MHLENCEFEKINHIIDRETYLLPIDFEYEIFD